MCRSINFEGYVAVDVQGRSGGLALLWKNKDGCKVTKTTRNYIDFEVTNEQVGSWRYTGFYGFPERQRRYESWEMLRSLAGESVLSWCVIGDFNDMMFDTEKRGGRKHPYSLLGFTETLHDCGLRDLGYVREQFTWERGRGQHNWVQERLDKGVATQSWCDLFPLTEVQSIEVTTSYHLPLFLNLMKQVYVPRAKRFKFENTWIREQDCRGVVKQGWESAGCDTILEKIRSCGSKLQEWGGSKIVDISSRCRIVKSCCVSYSQEEMRLVSSNIVRSAIIT